MSLPIVQCKGAMQLVTGAAHMGKFMALIPQVFLSKRENGSWVQSSPLTLGYALCKSCQTFCLTDRLAVTQSLVFEPRTTGFSEICVMNRSLGQKFRVRADESRMHPSVTDSSCLSLSRINLI